MLKFEVGDLVTFKYGWTDQTSIGIVTYAYMYNGHMWYKIQWNSGRTGDVAEIELRKVEDASR